jgi:hypothetical protein
MAFAGAAGCSRSTVDPRSELGWFSSEVEATRSVKLPQSADVSMALGAVLPEATRDRGLQLWRGEAGYTNGSPDSAIDASETTADVVPLDAPVAQRQSGDVRVASTGQYAVLLRARDGTLAAFTLETDGRRWLWSPKSPVGPAVHWAKRVIQARNVGQTIHLVPTAGPMLWAVVRDRTSEWLELVYFIPSDKASIEGHVLVPGDHYPVRFLVAPIGVGP